MGLQSQTQEWFSLSWPFSSVHIRLKKAGRNLQQSLARKCYLGFPGGSVVRNLPASAGDMGLIPMQEDPTCPRATKLMCLNCQVCALEPRSCNSWGPCTLGPMFWSKRSHCNAHAPQPENSPRLPQPENSPISHEDPAQPKINKYIFFYEGPKFKGKKRI